MIVVDGHAVGCGNQDHCGSECIADFGTREVKQGLLGAKLGSALGIRVKRVKSASYTQPIGQVTVALLCALARGGYPIQRTVQGNDGYYLEAMLPSNWLSWEGTISCIVTGKADGTDIQVGVTVRGQAFDYGRSERVVTTILSDAGRDSAAL